MLEAVREYATTQCALVSALAAPDLAAKLRGPMGAKLQAAQARLAVLEKRGGNVARLAAADAEAAWAIAQEVERWNLVMGNVDRQRWDSQVVGMMRLYARAERALTAVLASAPKSKAIERSKTQVSMLGTDDTAVNDTHSSNRAMAGVDLEEEEEIWSDFRDDPAAGCLQPGVGNTTSRPRSRRRDPGAADSRTDEHGLATRGLTDLRRGDRSEVKLEEGSGCRWGVGGESEALRVRAHTWGSARRSHRHKDGKAVGGSIRSVEYK